MSDTSAPRYDTMPSREGAPDYAQPTGWVGWIFFAGVIMIVMGSFHAIAGLAALFKDTYFVVGPQDLLISVDYTTWGWVHLLLGILVAIAGIALMVGRTWARVVGIVLAVISAIVNMAFLSAYPLWSALIIALDVIVIYAIAVHGGEAKYYAADG